MDSEDEDSGVAVMGGVFDRTNMIDRIGCFRAGGGVGCTGNRGCIVHSLTLAATCTGKEG